MKKIFFIFLFFLVCSNIFATNVVVEENTDTIDLNRICSRDFKEIIKESIPGVVEIKTFKIKNEKINKVDNNILNYTKSMDQKSVGSGFFISEDGYILTNNHVVDESDKIIVYYKNKEYEGELIGNDFYMDIALIKINVNNVKYFNIENNIGYEVGDDIITIGNPYGLGISVSRGIISGINRSMNNIEFFNLIQIDANISNGNSGGPLLNCNGDLIGINTILYDDNAAFAIPIVDIIDTVNSLKELGYVQRGWLGVSGVNANEDLLKILGSNRTSGVFVVNVDQNSPAHKAGIIPSDIIVSFDGKTIKTNEELIRMIRNTSVGSNIPLLILRNGKYIKVRAKVLDSPENVKYYDSNINYVDFMDMIAVEINDVVIDKYKLYSKIKGLYIIDVKENGLAYHYGIETGDTLLFINQKEINTKDDYEAAINSIKNSKEFLMIINKKNKDNVVLKLNYSIVN